MLWVAFMAVFVGVFLWLVNSVFVAQERMFLAHDRQQLRNRALWEQVERDVETSVALVRARRRGQGARNA